MERYQRGSLRLSSVTLAEVTRLALTEGWQLSDCVRTLVVLGATANWLALVREENKKVLKMKAELHELSERFGMINPSVRHRRPYAARHSRDTDVVGLILPNALARLIESYANLRQLSKNDLCGILLEAGLMIYMTAEKNLLQALVPADQRPGGGVVT